MGRKYAQGELEQFLRQVDAELARPCTIVLIGGAALSLGYRSTHATADMDLWRNAEKAAAPRGQSGAHRGGIGSAGS